MWRFQDYEWHLDYIKLAKDELFEFELGTYRKEKDGPSVESLNIRDVISKGDVSTVELFIPEILQFYLETEHVSAVLDAEFLKIFQLSQLSIEYLLFCKRYLDHRVHAMEAQINDYKKEVAQHELLVNEIHSDSDSRKHTTSYKCNYCPKSFVSEDFLLGHKKRRHTTEMMKCKRLEKNRKNESNKKTMLASDDREIHVLELHQNFLELRRRLDQELRDLRRNRYGRMVAQLDQPADVSTMPKTTHNGLNVQQPQQQQQQHDSAPVPRASASRKDDKNVDTNDLMQRTEHMTQTVHAEVHNQETQACCIADPESKDVEQNDTAERKYEIIEKEEAMAKTNEQKYAQLAELAELQFSRHSPGSEGAATAGGGDGENQIKRQQKLHQHHRQEQHQQQHSHHVSRPKTARPQAPLLSSTSSSSRTASRLPDTIDKALLDSSPSNSGRSKSNSSRSRSGSSSSSRSKSGDISSCGSLSLLTDRDEEQEEVEENDDKHKSEKALDPKEAVGTAAAVPEKRAKPIKKAIRDLKQAPGQIFNKMTQLLARQRHNDVETTQSPTTTTTLTTTTTSAKNEHQSLRLLGTTHINPRRDVPKQLTGGSGSGGGGGGGNKVNEIDEVVPPAIVRKRVLFDIEQHPTTEDEDLSTDLSLSFSDTDLTTLNRRRLLAHKSRLQRMH